jgi:hypothetical protein
MTNEMPALWWKDKRNEYRKAEGVLCRSTGWGWGVDNLIFGYKY